MSSPTTASPGTVLLVSGRHEPTFDALVARLRAAGHAVVGPLHPSRAAHALATAQVDLVAVDVAELTGPRDLEGMARRLRAAAPAAGYVAFGTGPAGLVVPQDVTLLPAGPPALVAAALAAQATLQVLTAENRRLSNDSTAELDYLQRSASELELRVTERTQEVTQAKREWEQTFDAIQDPLAILDSQLSVRRCNLALASFAGVPVQQAPGSRCWELLFGRGEACAGCPVPDTVRTLRPHQAEVRDPRRRGIFLVHAYPTLAPTGELLSVVCWYKDVTELRRLYHGMLQTEKMAALGTLAGGVAHEINNPLTAILTWTQILLSDVAPNSEVAESLREIEANTRRCTEVVRSLRYFARSEEQGIRQTLGLNGEIEAALRLMRKNCEQRGIEFDVRLATDLRPVVANVNEVRAMVSNLLLNASAALGDGPGRIGVFTRNEADGQVLLEVKDDGHGLDADAQDRLFEPFFSAHPSGHGEGLGLALTLGVVQGLGGSIDVQSQPGQGTQVSVRLPGSDATPGPPLAFSDDGGLS